MARILQILPEFLRAEGIRILQEKMQIFSAAARGTISLSYDREFLAQNGGDFIEPIVFARPSGGIQYADENLPTGSVTAVDILQAKGAEVTQGKFGYYQWNRDTVMRGPATPAEYTAALAEILAGDKLVAIRNTLIGAAIAAVEEIDSTDGTGSGATDCHILDVAAGDAAGGIVSITQSYLNQMLAKMKDAREDILVFLMPSNVYFDLVGDAMKNYPIDTVAGAYVVNGVPAAQGRAIIVADIPALTESQTSSYYTKYSVLALGAGQLSARVISEDAIDMDVITDENIKRFTFRQDFDTSYGIHGMKYDKAPVNPNDAEMATAGNWNEFFNDHREVKMVEGIFNSQLDTA